MSLKLYLITYDLLLPEPYESLKIRLGSLGARQLLDRAWALRTTRTAAELKDELRGFVDNRDRIVRRARPEQISVSNVTTPIRLARSECSARTHFQ